MPEKAYDSLARVIPTLSNTIYARQAPLEEAPIKTDCLTSIHYIMLKALNIHMPITWIGNMPRELSRCGWNFQKIDTADLKTGDITFLSKRSGGRIIDHVALLLTEKSVFHCKRNIGMVLEPLDSLFTNYTQEKQKKQLQYIDSRDKELRKAYGGSCFIREYEII